IVNDALHFCLRIDTHKLPSDLLRAYAAIELKALAATNPSGHPSARQKKEARETARERLEEEAKDGRFLKRKLFPVLWDAQSNEVLIGSLSANVVDRVQQTFQQTFGYSLEFLTAGRQAFNFAQTRQQTRGVDDAGPSPFVPGTTPTEIAWAPDE